MKNKIEKREEKPYERFVSLGAESLTDAELLAIILRTGTKGFDAVDISRKVLELGKYPRTGFLGIYDTDIDTLEKISGIGRVKAIKLKALAEVSRRMHEARVSEGLNVKNASSVAEYYMERMRHNKCEKVILLSIDSKGKVFYRVRIGPYTTSSEAEYWKTQVAKIDQFANVQSYIVNSSAKAVR